jgi:hypothetical protein
MIQLDPEKLQKVIIFITKTLDKGYLTQLEA